MARHRVSRRGSLESNLGGDEGSVDMGDVTAVTSSKHVPTNPDGTIATEGEVSEDQAKLIGSLSVESDRKNKRMAGKLRDKALGKSVQWNSDDALELIQNLTTVFALEWGSMIILVARIEPGPRAQLPPVMGANIKTPVDLYNYVASHHGPNGPATYKVSFRSSSGAERGAANLFMPDRTPAPTVQVIQPPQQQQPSQQYTQAPQPQYGGGQQGGQGGQGQGGGYPVGPGGSQYWQPPQQQPIIVVSQPQAPQQPTAAPQQAAPAPVPVPMPPQYMPQPPQGPSSSDTTMRMMFEMMQAQNAQTMNVLKDVLETLKKPQMPAGYIPLPSDDYPVPHGYVKVPGGCLPAPPVHVPQQPVPVGVGYVPAAAAPATPAPVVIQTPAPPAQPSFDQQIRGTVAMMKNVVGGMSGDAEPICRLRRPAGSCSRGGRGTSAGCSASSPSDADAGRRRTFHRARSGDRKDKLARDAHGSAPEVGRDDFQGRRPVQACRRSSSRSHCKRGQASNRSRECGSSGTVTSSGRTSSAVTTTGSATTGRSSGTSSCSAAVPTSSSCEETHRAGSVRSALGRMTLAF